MYSGVKKMLEEEKSPFVLSLREEIKNRLNELNDKKPLSIQVNEKRLMKKRFIHFFSNPTTP